MQTRNGQQLHSAVSLTKKLSVEETTKKHSAPLQPETATTRSLFPDQPAKECLQSEYMTALAPSPMTA